MAAPHLFSDAAIDQAKSALRRQVLAARPGGDPASILSRLAELPLPGVVAGVWPLPGEIDLRALLTGLHARGHTVVLPQTPPRGAALVFRRWRPEGALLPGRFGTLYPDGEVMVPQALLVPLLAFDLACHRLGYGGGYYDRTLAALPGVPAIGYGWAAQQVARLPIGGHDRALDAVATEHGLIERPRSEHDRFDHALFVRV